MEGPLEERAAKTLILALSDVPDPRKASGRRYSIGSVLALSVCAMLCGAKSLYAIAQWGRDHGAWAAKALGIERGRTPCVATLHLLYKRLDTSALERVLSEWFLAQGVEANEAVALDGKSLRGLHGDEVPGVHLVAAYLHGAGRVLAQSGGRDQQG